MKTKTITLLSIDPSLTSTGYAVWGVEDWRLERKTLLDFGCYKTRATDSDGERLDCLTGTIREIIRCQMVDVVVYEKATAYNYGNRGQKNIQKYRDAVAHVDRACADMIGRENVYGVTAPTWKGTGKKHSTIKKVNLVFGLELKQRDNDAADAIGIGMWFIGRQRVAPIKHDFTG
jgi:Holliday junction resolvasome RuvABC endonuclease subunit